jgi:hypothetical protein
VVKIVRFAHWGVKARLAYRSLPMKINSLDYLVLGIFRTTIINGFLDSLTIKIYQEGSKKLPDIELMR